MMFFSIKSKFFTAIYLSVFSLIFFPLQTLAIGVTPSQIEVADLANGVDVTREMNLTRNGKLDEAYFSISIGGTGGRFVTAESEQVIMKAGQKTVPVVFHIKPKAAPNGDYRAEITFLETAAPISVGGTNSVSVLSGVIGKILFSVTDQEVKGLEIKHLEVYPTEVESPPSFSFEVINTGNVDVRPDSIAVSLVDVTDPTHVFSDTILADTLDFTSPAATKRVSAVLTKSLPLGEYKAQFKFLFGDKIVLEETAELKVWPVGTLAQTGELVNFSVDGTTYKPGELVKFSGAFNNTGELTAQATWYVEIKKNGKTVELLKSDKKSVARKSTSDFILTWRAQDSGKYTAESYVEFGAKKSDKKELEFKVTGSKVFLTLVIGGGILLALAVSGIIFWMHRRHQKHQPKQHQKRTK